MRKKQINCAEVGVSETDIKVLAKEIAEALKEHHSCQLSPDEQQAVRDIVRTKKSAVKGALWVVGLLAVWAIKDIYHFILSHLWWNG